jgi:mRNA interferase MazF
MEVEIDRSLRRGDVCLIELDPTRGSEIRKKRPCLVVSPDEHNRHLRTLIVVPMTTTGGQPYPWRVACRFQSKVGSVAVHQLRTVDSERITKKLGRISPNTLDSVLQVLQEMFAR